MQYTKTLFSILLPIFLFLSIWATAQNYYVNTMDSNGLNVVYRLDVGYCNIVKIPTCPIHEQVLDMSFDKDNNMWYVVDGNLIKQNLNDANTCEAIGSFTKSGWVNSLVSDPVGIIYAVGMEYNNNKLFKYEKGVFSTLGVLPSEMLPSGDMFFYEDRLFLTCQNYDSFFIAEITLPDPTLSYSYMRINSAAYGAFSITKNGKSESYIITTNNSTSALVALDMPNHKLRDTICTYPFTVYGAASYYDPLVNNIQIPSCKVYLPNAFTPNNDGLNDLYTPRITGDHNLQLFEIVNRFGQVVFHSTNEDIGWDGKFNNTPQEIGTYFYYLKCDCANGSPVITKGDLTLIR